MAELFNKNVRTISEHIKNIFSEKELDRESVIRNFRITANDSKQYDTQHYNLDVIISVGYRIRSKEGTQFRQWATQILKQHLIQGYTFNESRLAQQGMKDLQNAIALLRKTLIHQKSINDMGAETLNIIIRYAKTWRLLLAYDESSLALPTQRGKETKPLLYSDAVNAINSLMFALAKEAGNVNELFGKKQTDGLESILGNIEQTFDSKFLYQTVEEKAAHLLYLIIKDHPFCDGNERIASFLFLLYLRQQNIVEPLNENGLTALTLLISESEPQQKDMMIRLITNLINDDL